MPHKRFVTEVVQDRSQAFLGTDQSYRASVRPNGRELVYDDRQDEALAREGAALSHSTVWRWLSWLGDGLQRTFREARRLIRAREPRSPLHRQDWRVSSAKYRSEPRRQTLATGTASAGGHAGLPEFVRQGEFSPTSQRVGTGAEVISRSSPFPTTKRRFPMSSRRERHEQWAIFWCSLLAPLLYGEIPAAEAGRFLRNCPKPNANSPMGSGASPPGPRCGVNGRSTGKAAWTP